jgi:hypothetical protein
LLSEKKKNKKKPCLLVTLLCTLISKAVAVYSTTSQSKTLRGKSEFEVSGIVRDCVWEEEFEVSGKVRDIGKIVTYL